MSDPTPSQIAAHLAAGGLIERKSGGRWRRSDRFPLIAERDWASFPDDPFPNYRLVP